jgi:hypothetical protein
LGFNFWSTNEHVYSILIEELNGSLSHSPCNDVGGTLLGYPWREDAGLMWWRGYFLFSNDFFVFDTEELKESAVPEVGVQNSGFIDRDGYFCHDCIIESVESIVLGVIAAVAVAISSSVAGSEALTHAFTATSGFEFVEVSVFVFRVAAAQSASCFGSFPFGTSSVVSWHSVGF